MKIKLYLIALALTMTSFSFAQTPQLINYQAVVRDNSLSPLAITPVLLRFTIHDGSASGATLYTETSSQLTTNQFGLVNTIIGQNANLGVVSWGVNTKWLQVEVNVNSAGFTNMGTQQLVSVPYALYADSTKEHQTLSISGNQLSISSGNTITLPNSSGSSSSIFQQTFYQNDAALVYASSEPGVDSFAYVTTDNLGIAVKDAITGQYIAYPAPALYPSSFSFSNMGITSATTYQGNIYCTTNSGIFLVSMFSGTSQPVTLLGATFSSGVIFTDGTLIYLHSGGDAWTRFSVSGTTFTNVGSINLLHSNGGVSCFDGTYFYSMANLSQVLTLFKYDSNGTLLSQKSLQHFTGFAWSTYNGLVNIDASKLYLLNSPTYPLSIKTTNMYPIGKP